MDNATSPLDRAIELCGGQAALARVIGTKQQNVAYWRTAVKGVPAEMAQAIEDASGGKVTRQELRPDVFGPPSQPSEQEGQAA